jgi:hypothetical protein
VEKVELTAALERIDALWSPRIVARYNGNKVVLGKAKGEFVWHSHPETDDLFLVLEGRLTIDLRDRSGRARAGRALRRPGGRRAPASVGGGRLDPPDRAGGNAEHRRPRDGRARA